MTTELALPDVNAETYPYELVQHLLDQTANFNIFAVPDAEHTAHATLTPSHVEDFFGINGGYGIDVRSNLHRFDATIQASKDGFLVGQSVGDRAGSLRCRFLFGPRDFPWSPSGE